MKHPGSLPRHYGLRLSVEGAVEGLLDSTGVHSTPPRGAVAALAQTGHEALAPTARDGRLPAS